MDWWCKMISDKTIRSSGDMTLASLPNSVQQLKPPPMILVPAGSFFMGTSPGQVQELLAKEDWAREWYDSDLFQTEQPYHAVTLDAFEIAQYPVTNIEYFQFIWNSGYRAPRGWMGFHYPDDTADHPVTGVSKKDALAYVAWLSKETMTPYRLPTEAEWERAARGLDGRMYPWGDEFDPWRCNTSESGKRSASSVGMYSPLGDSQCGAMDMVGNVWEWTTSLMKPYPYNPNDGREDLSGDGKSDVKCVVRGGSWYYSRKLARCAAREAVLASYLSPALGFRLARTPAK